MYATVAMCGLCVAAPVPPPAELADAYEFGVSPREVRAMYELAFHHPWGRQAEVRAWNLPAVAERWELECDWRRQVWDRLDDVVNCPGLPLDRKVWALRRVRELLGDDAYFGRRLPAPIPTYRTGPQD